MAQSVATMDRPTFWRLIDTIDRAALRSGDEDGAVQPLIQTLARYGEKELQEFVIKPGWRNGKRGGLKIR